MLSSSLSSTCQTPTKPPVIIMKFLGFFIALLLFVTSAAGSAIPLTAQNDTAIHAIPFSLFATRNDTASLTNRGWDIEAWVKKVSEQPVTNGPFCLTPWSDKTCAFSTHMDVIQSNIEMWFYDHNCKELGIFSVCQFLVTDTDLIVRLLRPSSYASQTR